MAYRSSSFLSRLCTVAACVAGAALPAAADTAQAVFVASNGWAVMGDRALAECGTLTSDRYGDVVARIEDPSHRLTLIRFDVDNVPALASERRARVDDPVSIIFARAGSRGLEVRNTRITATTLPNGDASFLTARHTREHKGQSQFVLNDAAELVGVTTRWRDDKRTAVITKAPYITMLLNANGAKHPLRRTARRIQDAMVDVSCARDHDVVDAPDFSEETLDDFGAEVWAKAFTELYQQAWSSPNADALEFVEQVYGQRVKYFGKRFSKSEVMRDKANFAKRWDFRSYALRDDTLEITCGARSCTVSGQNDYFTYASKLAKTSSGVAKFSFDLDLDTLEISRENSSVVSRSGANPEGMFADWIAVQQACGTGDAAACERADYLAVVIGAYDYCFISRNPRGRRADTFEAI